MKENPNDLDARLQSSAAWCAEVTSTAAVAPKAQWRHWPYQIVFWSRHRNDNYNYAVYGDLRVEKLDKNMLPPAPRSAGPNE